MTSPLELASGGVPLDPAGREHLERLMASWSLLADFSFSDLLLYQPLERLPLLEEPDEARRRFVVLGQIRPTTSQTLFELDLVGQVVAASEVPLVLEAARTGRRVSGTQRADVADGEVNVECVPVRHEGAVLAVCSRVWSPTGGRRTGTLERVYLDLYNRLATMVADGVFPFVADDAAVEEAPRVGDGVIVLDATGRVVFASPNAVNALHRMGIVAAAVGSTLSGLGLETSAVSAAFATRTPVIEEVERRPDVIVLLRCIPLLEAGEVTGAAVLVRDVTDLRRRDRLLLSKDAAIREVHHRVKNNLQTISSLLRLQARRLEDGAGRTALLEAERRVRAIALVHEILSREAGDQVPFDEIVHALVRSAQEASDAGTPLSVRVEGDLGEVPAEVATPLAVVVAELLQNAVEHAFPPGAPGSAWRGAAPQVDLVLREEPAVFVVEVRDNGVGVPPGFDLDRTRSLGLSIVRDLVRTQLGGTIRLSSGAGTTVHLEIPRPPRPLRRA
jgi:two-component sensor histidine kinase